MINIVDYPQISKAE